MSPFQDYDPYHLELISDGYLLHFSPPSREVLLLPLLSFKHLRFPTKIYKRKFAVQKISPIQERHCSEKHHSQTADTGVHRHTHIHYVMTVFIHSLSKAALVAFTLFCTSLACWLKEGICPAPHTWLYHFVKADFFLALPLKGLVFASQSSHACYSNRYSQNLLTLGLKIQGYILRAVIEAALPLDSCC